MENKFRSNNQNVITITNNNLLIALQSLLNSMPASAWYSELAPLMVYGFYSYSVECNFGPQTSNPIINAFSFFTATSASDAASQIGTYLNSAINSTISGVSVLNGTLQLLSPNESTCINPTIVEALNVALMPGQEVNSQGAGSYGSAFLAMQATAAAIYDATVYPSGNMGVLIRQITSNFPTSACNPNDATCFEEVYYGIYLVMSTLLAMTDTNSYDANWYSNGGYKTILFAPLYNLFGKNAVSSFSAQKMTNVLNGFAFARTAIEQILKTYPAITETVFKDLTTVTDRLAHPDWGSASSAWQQALTDMGY